MQEYLIVTGIVIKSQPVGESDRRITLLTNSRGKIGVFARGARKPTSRFSGTTGSFCFGTFKLYEGRDSYTLAEADISNYFEDLMTDVEGASYAAYFAEVADYYCRENNDERDMMKLFYQSLRALINENIPNRLIKSVYEIKALVVNGEYPGVPENANVSDGVRMAMEHIAMSRIEKLYTFVLSDESMDELARIADKYREKYMDTHFKSLEILEML
ncbi:MAG: DNA repair protein RecO [Lachnospiraceae bacterium]|nr:DNA repair protein RecO [Lachnospiraceae bacterium]